ncbi:hypothetical protein [Xenorhabdus cabanillasii]|uniref:Uncharacterized protein n=2 Tax=Morganellaceae TaxID=1903414 RepID=W1IN90_9GAMM|nr:hypothetical protein [Xenorhabdus cabanillasii]MDE1485853.1 hypothetical protein [Xenorhabdus bovienii]MDE9476648.1 hypothetical protein [Xenorhabdus bovienii]MDE9529439.1 hypothetical protein [Xenorhabdus bovienii]MDE9533674.1 hypothetical protein [Xenorhabdus bovienii]MDE9587762.1 hypothetical protein [Xenorhabdus bovienii]
MYGRNDTEKHQDLIKKLSLIDNLENWPSHTLRLEKEDKKHVYEFAKRLWIKRKISDGSLLLHPDVREELIQREFNPLSIHKKMIWASLLASYDGADSQEYFQRIKGKIIKKYGNKWWLDVYNRIKPTYAARQHILKYIDGAGAAVKYAASQSMFLGDVYRESRNDALRMIPKE